MKAKLTVGSNEMIKHFEEFLQKTGRKVVGKPTIHVQQSGGDIRESWGASFTVEFDLEV